MAEKVKKGERIGIYSGTFDPVHEGHIAFARESITACLLDQVIFLPERSPRAKKQVTDFGRRVAQLEAATEKWPHISVLTLKQPSFTVQETLPELQNLFAGAHLMLLVGSDVIRGSFAGWPHIDELVHTVSFAVGIRSSDTLQDLENVRNQIQVKFGMPLDITYVKTDFAHLSSSQLRS